MDIGGRKRRVKEELMERLLGKGVPNCHLWGLPLGLIVLGLLALVRGISAQDRKIPYLEYLEQGRYEELSRALSRVPKGQLSDPVVLFLKGLVEKDGQKATKIYKDFCRKFPDNPLTPQIQLRIGQFLFAQGFYINARKVFLEIREQYRHTFFAQKASYLAALCLMSIGASDSARFELENLLRSRPDPRIRELALDDLRAISAARGELARFGANVEQKTEPRYAVQVGAFRHPDNANTQKRFLEAKGYKKVEIGKKVINGMVYFVVWVGEFDNVKRAIKLGEKIKKQFGLEYRVVDKSVHSY